MNWWKDGFYSHTPNEVTWSEELSDDAKLLFNMIASCIKQPVFISYTDINRVTGWSKKRISAAIKELVKRKIINFRPGGLYPGKGKKKANEFSINPSRDQWVVGSLAIHPCTSVPPRNREKKHEESVGSNTELNSVPLGNTNKEERLGKNDTTKASPSVVSGVVSSLNTNGTTGRTTLPPGSPLNGTGTTHSPNAYQPETDDQREKRERAEIEQYATDPRYIEIFGSSEKVRAHFNHERGIENGHQEDGDEVAKDGHGEMKS